MAGWGSTRRSLDERRDAGRQMRKNTPRSSHADWEPGPDRADPVSLLEAQNEDRLPFLVPVRHWRMSQSAFTFYRGTAKIMAADLAGSPDMGETVQLCGDAHLSNFGYFASPERTLVFDCNDFDETLPGPWEWDLKRLAVSGIVAARDRGFSKSVARDVTRRSVAAYREAMSQFSDMGFEPLRYSHVSADQIGDLIRSDKDQKGYAKVVAKAKTKTSLQALDKLAEEADGQYRIESDPPVLIPMRDMTTDHHGEIAVGEALRDTAGEYLSTLRPDRADFLRRFKPIDFALKVVGVGSVGTRCFIILLEGRDRQDPLFLQIKEATRSVLEDHLPKSRYRHPGRRVVEGQYTMQTTSDTALGWSQIARDTGTFYFYWRHLKDMKGSADVDRMNERGLGQYMEVCGATLARGHARSGDPAVISGYLGSGDVFDKALVTFSEKYADQVVVDYQAFEDAIASGRIASQEG